MIVLKQATYNDPTLEGGKFQEMRDRIQAEINGLLKGGNYTPKTEAISFEKFAKTEAEKLQLKEMRQRNKTFVKRAGLNPKKFMNDPKSNMGVINK